MFNFIRMMLVEPIVKITIEVVFYSLELLDLGLHHHYQEIQINF